MKTIKCYELKNVRGYRECREVDVPEHEIPDRILIPKIDIGSLYRNFSPELVAGIVEDNILNTFDTSKGEIFLVCLLKSHPTLQQNFTRLCWKWFKKMAENIFIDARNEASKKMGEKVMEATKDITLPFI